MFRQKLKTTEGYYIRIILIQKEGTIHGKMLYLSETVYALTMNFVLHAPGESDQMEDTEPTGPVENVLATPSTTGDR